MPQEALRYESAQFDSLQEGEVTVWEGPEPAPVSLFSSRSRVGAAVFAAAAVVCSAVLIPVAAPAALVVFVVGLCLGGFFFHTSYRDELNLARRRCRVTNQRVIIQDRNPQQRASIGQHELRRINQSRTRRGCSVVVNGSPISLTSSAGADELTAVILDLVHRSNRRQAFRRSPRSQVPRAQRKEQSMPASPTDAGSELLLQPGEALLWSGHPRVWEGITPTWWRRRFVTLAWCGVWGVVGFSCSYLLRGGSQHAMIILGACVGLLGFLICLYNLLISPFRHAARRKRTTYFLTNLRAVTKLRRRSTSIDSVFLDMAQGVSLELHDDGTGDVLLSHLARFERLPDASEVHRLLIEAIRATPSTLQPAPVEMDDDEAR